MSAYRYPARFRLRSVPDVRQSNTGRELACAISQRSSAVDLGDCIDATAHYLG